MPRKKDLSADRLRKHVEMETNPIAHTLGLVNDAALLGPAYEAALRVKKSDWNNGAQRATAAHQALSLDDLDHPFEKGRLRLSVSIPAIHFTGASWWRISPTCLSVPRKRAVARNNFGLMISFASSCRISTRSKVDVRSCLAQKYRISKFANGLSGIQSWARHTMGSAPERFCEISKGLAILKRIVAWARSSQRLPIHINCVQ